MGAQKDSILICTRFDFILFNSKNSKILFQPYLPEVSNSQGREQTHSEMEKCVDSLSQMNYKNFMLHMKVFFGLTNLKHRGVI